VRSSGALSATPSCAPTSGLEYGYSAKGEIQLERKEDMKRRGLASPDIGDALALTFAQPVAVRWLYHQPGEVRFIGGRDEDYDPFHDALAP